MVPDEVRAKCAEINEKFGTKIFLSSNHKEDSAVLEYVKQELREWQKASGGEAKTPPTLDFSVIRREYIDGGSAFGQGASGGLQNVETRAISIDGTRLEAVKYAIRHELTHANSTNDGLNIGTKHNLDEIMPRKLNKDRMVVPDIENCKYKQEFYNAGISKEQTEYAHNSPEEFIAVASEGDMSKYSPEFKQILVDFGMPKWMFKMKPKNEIAKGLVV